VLGVDGFDLAFAERLATSGQLPAIGALLGGARAAIAPDADADPRGVDLVATGQPVAIHGVRGIEAVV